MNFILFASFSAAPLFTQAIAASRADQVVTSYVDCVEKNKSNESQLMGCAKSHSTIAYYKTANDKTKLWVGQKMTPESVSCDKRLLRTLGLNKPQLGTPVCYKLRSKQGPSRKVFFVVQGDRISDLKIF